MSNKVKGLDGRWIILLLFVSLASPAAASSNLDLVEAVEKGATDTVRSLLEQRADVRLLEQEAVTEILFRRRGVRSRRVIERREDSVSPPVGHVVEQIPVAA